MGIKIANTMFSGTGTKQPKGILKEEGIATVEWDLATLDDAGKVDALITLLARRDLNFIKS